MATYGCQLHDGDAPDCWTSRPVGVAIHHNLIVLAAPDCAREQGYTDADLRDPMDATDLKGATT